MRFAPQSRSRGRVPDLCGHFCGCGEL